MLKTLLTSKKFLAALSATIVAALAKVGLDLDDSAVLLIVSPLMAYIVGQGIADHGKERAKVIVDAISIEDATDAAEEELSP